MASPWKTKEKRDGLIKKKKIGNVFSTTYIIFKILNLIQMVKV